MRKSHRHTFIGLGLLSSLFFGLTAPQAAAQITTDVAGTPIILPSTSSSYNQNGFNLPNIPSLSGQDIVRGSGGLTCHSAIANNGANFDMGVIGSNDIFNRDSVSVYGRVTVPLGKRPKRIDCSKLYDLEISRLKMELQLMRAGAFTGMMDRTAAQRIITQAPPPPKSENNIEQTIKDKKVAKPDSNKNAQKVTVKKTAALVLPEDPKAKAAETALKPTKLAEAQAQIASPPSAQEEKTQKE